MNACLRLVAIVAGLVLGANAFGLMAEISPQRMPFEVPCESEKACEFAGGDRAGRDGLSSDSKLIGGKTAAELWFDRFVLVVGIGLFLAWFVGIVNSRRYVAMAAGACVATLAQVIYLYSETTEGLEGSQLYPHILLRLLSCCMVACLAAAGTSFHVIPPSPARWETQLARATVPALLVATFAFEIMYTCSRLPVISPVSLSLALRPLSKVMEPTVVIFIAVWWASYLCLLGDSRPSSPGPDCAADGTPGPG